MTEQDQDQDVGPVTPEPAPDETDGPPDDTGDDEDPGPKNDVVEEPGS